MRRVVGQAALSLTFDSVEPLSGASPWRGATFEPHSTARCSCGTPKRGQPIGRPIRNLILIALVACGTPKRGQPMAGSLDPKVHVVFKIQCGTPKRGQPIARKEGEGGPWKTVLCGTPKRGQPMARRRWTRTFARRGSCGTPERGQPIARGTSPRQSTHDARSCGTPNGSLLAPSSSRGFLRHFLGNTTSFDRT